MTPELERYLRPTDRGLIVQKPTRDLALYGLMVALLLPIACCLLTGLVAVAAGVGEAGDDSAAVFGVVVVISTLAPFVAGLVLLALAPMRSQRSAVEIDRVGASLRRADGSTTSLLGTRAVALVKPTMGLDWLALALVIDGRPPVLVLKNLHPLQRAKWGRVAAGMAQALGLTYDGLAESPASAKPNHKLGAACYLPFAGLFLLVSLFNVNHADAWIRFHARQSLLLGGVAIGLVVPLIAAGGVAIALAPREALPFAVLALAGSVGLIQLTRLVVRIAACVQAYRGRTWLIPGISRWSQRWHPESGPRQF